MPPVQKRLTLVLGGTRGIGGEAAAALARHGWQVRALAHDPAAGTRRNPGWEWVRGDAMDRASVVKAAAGAGLIVHAVNPPGYRQWDKLVLPMLDHTIEAARASGRASCCPA